MKKIIMLMLGWLLLFGVIVSAQTLKKHPDDQSMSRYFVLENGLKVLMISDPEFNNSAAALEVNVGSLMDPKNRQGLAHFLEHMLFMGTEKYPDVEDFEKFLKKNGGNSNAYTSEDSTNYFFEIQHETFEGALDRFSQFFISPLFSNKYINREKKAVHSEHQKNLQQDTRRKQQLFRKFFRKDHPGSHFASGNLLTLEGIAREEFIEFYNRYYSSNQMSLALLSNQNLDKLESSVRQYFSGIKNLNKKTLTYDPNYINRKESFRLIRQVPIKDLRELTINFSIPDFLKHFKNQPEGFIAFCLGHEGKGSLLSYLKKQNLATGLSAGSFYPTKNYGTFNINIQLTSKGLTKYQDIITACFSYLNMLKKQGIPKHIFDEVRKMAEMDYTYGNKGEGSSRASFLARKMNRFPIEFVEKIGYIHNTPDDHLIQEVLSFLEPNNMTCMLTAKDLHADQVEPYYGTKYSFHEEKNEFYLSLLNPPTIEDLSLPLPNQFLPERIHLLAERPINVLNEPGVELWYAQDITFKRPKISLKFEIQLPKYRVSPEYLVRLLFYASCINEQLNELTYPAYEAGLNYDFSAGLDSVDITMSGYVSSTQMLLKEIGKQLKSVHLSDQQFQAIKDRKLRKWSNFRKEQAWQMAQFYSSRIRRETYFSIDTLLKEGKKVTLSDVKKLATTLYDENRIQGLIHGNISSDDSISLLRLLQSYIPSDSIKKEDVFKRRTLVEKPNNPLTYVETLETNNSCFLRTTHLGEETPELRIGAKIIGKFISQPFYTELRTEQQLGYIVSAFPISDIGQYYLLFMVQSASHPADQIQKRVNQFTDELLEKFNKLSDVEFETFKQAIRSGLLEAPKAIKEKRQIFSSLTFYHDQDFDRLQDNLDTLENITKNQVADLLSNSIDPDTQKTLDILLFAKQHQIMGNTKGNILSINEFKAGRKFVEKPKRR